MLLILYIFIGVIAFILLFALFIKKEYSLVSEITINKPSDVVFDYVTHLSNQKYFSKWVMADPDIKITNTGIDGTVGFISAWTSDLKNVGVGAQEITKIVPGKSYDAELRFEKPFKGVSYANTTLHAVSPGQTKVIITFNTKTDFPMSAMIPLIKNMLKKDMDENAANLKRVLEA